MKKTVCWMVCLMLIVAIIGVAFAEEGIMPCYMYVNSIKASLSVSAGTATAVGNVIPSGGLKTSVIVRLQRESSPGSWITLSIWTGNNESGKSEAGGKKAIMSGYNYRVYVTGKVYDNAGTVIETVNKYSTTKAY